jgi:hypothetical protein
MSIRKTKEQFIAEATIVHNNKYDYTMVNYKNSHTSVTIKCPIHGFFEQKPYIHIDRRTGGHGCFECNIGMRTLDNFLKLAKEVHGDKYNYDEVVWEKPSKKIKIICDIHGIFEMIPTSHIRAKQGCIYCAGRQMTTEEWLRRVKKRRPDFDNFDYSLCEYIDARTPIKIICLEHGEFIKKCPSHFYIYGCPDCVLSGHHSKFEKTWLDLYKIPKCYRNYSLYLNDNIGKGYLYVDGYNPEEKTVYEFYGDYWHGNPKKYNKDKTNPNSKKTFGELYEMTIARENRIKQCGYNLITIWEKDFINNKYQHEIQASF